MSKRRAALFGFLAIGLGVAWYSYAVANRPLPLLDQPALRAFINADWGMSKEEVEKANGLPLERAVSSPIFYKTDPGTDDSRHQTWRSEGQRFLGRPGTVYYTFLNGRFFAFHVFITDSDGEKLDADMKRYLEGKFGPDYGVEEEGPALKRIWENNRRIVNYWFYERESSLIGRYKAGYGVLYRPLERTAAVDS